MNPSEKNRARMREALEERGFFAQQPDPVAPAPPAQPAQAPLRWNDPETFRRVGEGEMKFWGGLANDVGGALSHAFEPVNRFHRNLVERTERDGELQRRYLPEIKRARRGELSANMVRTNAHNARMGATATTYGRELDQMQARIAPDLRDENGVRLAMTPQFPVTEMSYDELIAAIKEEHARAGR